MGTSIHLNKNDILSDGSVYRRGYPAAMASLPEHLRPSPVGRERLPREVVAEHQRDRILRAATEVFAERGYRGATVDHIVAAAQVGVGSFYERFDNKGACFVAAYDRIVAAARERIAAALRVEGAWGKRLVAGLRALLVEIEADPAAARLALVEVHAAGPAALARHERNLDEAAAVLRVGRAQGDVAADLPQTLEFATVAGLSWYLQQRIAAGEAGEATALLPDLLEIVSEPYLVA
jgi:AcrR family transcriptional regulator